MTQYNLSVGDIALLVEAVNKAASRHESEARFSPHRAMPHDRKAEAMRALCAKLLKKRELAET